MKHEASPVLRASRSVALALPFASLLGLPREAIDEVKASSRRAIRNCRASVQRVAAKSLKRRKERRIESPPVARPIEASQVNDGMPGQIEIEAAIAERARCARIVRRGIDLGVGPHAAALAFNTSLKPDAAIALVERLASISNEA